MFSVTAFPIGDDVNLTVGGIQLEYFNQALYNQLNRFLNQPNEAYRALWVYGDSGHGKSYAIYNQLKRFKIPYRTVVFSDENIFPFNTIVEAGLCCAEDPILMEASTLFQSGYAIVFENIEKAKTDHVNLILRLLRYHKNANKPAMVIFEQNTYKNRYAYFEEVTTSVQDVPCTSKEDFMKYLSACFLPHKSNHVVFEKIVAIANSNIQNFFVCLNILKHEGIIGSKYGKLFLKKPKAFIPDNLLSLYGQLFDNLDRQMQEPFRTSAPFSTNMYDRILRVIIRNYSNFEYYLSEISGHESIIKVNETNDSNSLFKATYSFVTEAARNAVCKKISYNEQVELIRKYYDYLDKIYHNRSEFNLISESDKLLLLINLTKDRGSTLTVNQVPLVIDIMVYYYEHKLYFSVAEQGKRLLETNILNEQQLNLSYHSFYLVYFRALLTIGDYHQIISYMGHFMDEDINFIIATALYNLGRPNTALSILMSIKTNIHPINPGYKENLLAAIYDWLGDNKASATHFKSALRAAVKEDNLKFQLYKKYSMYVDFRLPECQEKLKQAISFYAEKDLKQYAECLHNFGTGLIMQFDYELGKECLDQSLDVLSEICSDEVYYPLNSLAISYCYDTMRFEKAIELWTNALKLNINIDFCKLAIQNNLFLAYIHTNNHTEAEKLRISLETTFIEVCQGRDLINTLRELRPDLQHQLRQFYYNCAIFYKRNGLLSESLHSFYKAKHCSRYNSVLLYAINKNILDLESVLGFVKLYKKKMPHPSKQEAFIYKQDMYFCEIMFWG